MADLTLSVQPSTSAYIALAIDELLLAIRPLIEGNKYTDDRGRFLAAAIQSLRTANDCIFAAKDTQADPKNAQRSALKVAQKAATIIQQLPMVLT